MENDESFRGGKNREKDSGSPLKLRTPSTVSTLL